MKPFKKRTITKASIDELAARYPQNIINEEDASRLIGGVCYYDIASGAYIGAIGHSDEIRFVSRDVFNDFLSNSASGGESGTITPSVNEYDNPVYNSSSAWSRGLSSAQLRIIATEAQSIFPRDQNGNPITVKIGSANYAMGLNASGELRVNLNFDHMGNMANIRSLLIHELYHYQQEHHLAGVTGAITDANKGIELEAIMAQISDASWNNVSNGLKEKTAEELVKCGYTLEQARALVKL